MAEPYKENISGYSSYASGLDLIEYRDWRLLGDLIRDDDKRSGSSAEVAASDRVQRAIDTATGMIESEIFHGGRYTRADMLQLLASITSDGGSGYTVARRLLQQLCCDLAFWVLLKRRKPDVVGEKIAGVKEALETLVRLRNGEAVFPFQEVMDAGVMDVAVLDPNVSRADYLARTTFKTSVSSSRLFGNRSKG